MFINEKLKLLTFLLLSFSVTMTITPPPNMSICPKKRISIKIPFNGRRPEPTWWVYCDNNTVIITPDNATYVNSDLITWETLKLKNNPLLLILLKLQSEITIHNKTLTSLYIESAVNSINYTFPRDWIEYSVKTYKDWPKWAVLNNLAKSYNKTRSKSILMHFRRIHK